MAASALAMYTAVATATPVVSALLPGLTCFRDKAPSLKVQKLLLALSAGLLFSIATMDLIPEAVELGYGGAPPHSEGVGERHVDRQLMSHNEQAPRHTHRSHHTRAESRGPHCAPCPSAKPSEEVLEFCEKNGEGRGACELAESHSTRTEREAGNDVRSDKHAVDVGESARVAMLGVGCGFLLLLTVDFVMRMNGHAHSHGSKKVTINDMDLRDMEAHSHAGEGSGGELALSRSLGVTALVALGVHSGVDGFVIASAFSASASVGVRVALALCLHKIPDGLVMASLLSPNLAKGESPYGFYSKLAGLAVCTPLGALLGYMLTGGVSVTALGVFLGFGAGTFLFLSATAILPELAHMVTPHDSSEAIGVLLAVVVAFVGFGLYASQE